MSENFPNLPVAIAEWIACDPASRSLASLSRLLRVSRATLTRWHRGEEPEVKRIQQIAKALGVTVGYLAGDEEYPRNQREMDLLLGFRTRPPEVQAAIELLAAPPPRLLPPPNPD